MQTSRWRRFALPPLLLCGAILAYLGSAFLADTPRGAQLGLIPPLWMHRTAYEAALPQLLIQPTGWQPLAPGSGPTPRGQVLVDHSSGARVLFPTAHLRGQDVQGWLWSEQAPPTQGWLVLGEVEFEARFIEPAGGRWYRVWRRLD